MSARIALVVTALCLAITGSAWARSAGFLIGDVTGKTANADQEISVIFDATNNKLWNVDGKFRCPDAPDSDPVYSFATGGVKKTTWSFGKRLSTTVKATYGYQDDNDTFKAVGKATVTLTATIRKTRDYSANPKHKGKATGSGTVKIATTKCTVPTVTWKGKGTFEPN